MHKTLSFNRLSSSFGLISIDEFELDSVVSSVTDSTCVTEQSQVFMTHDNFALGKIEIKPTTFVARGRALPNAPLGQLYVLCISVSTDNTK